MAQFNRFTPNLVRALYIRINHLEGVVKTLTKKITSKEDDNKISFGKHRGKTWKSVFDVDKQYCRWVKTTFPKNHDFWLFQKYIIISEEAAL